MSRCQPTKVVAQSMTSLQPHILGFSLKSFINQPPLTNSNKQPPCVSAPNTPTPPAEHGIIGWVNCDICPVFTDTSYGDKSVGENEQTAQTSPQSAGCRRVVTVKETSLCDVCKQKDAEKKVKKENSLPRRLTRRMTGIFGLDKGVHKWVDWDKLLDKEEK